MNKIESASSVVSFFFFFFLLFFFLAQHFTLVALELTELELDRDDPVVDQVLESEELKDVASASKKCARP